MSRSSFGWCILALGLHGIARAQPYYGDSGQWGSSFNVTQLGEHVILLPNSGYGKVLIFGPETTSPTQAAQYQVVSLDANGNLSTQTVPRPGLGETHQRCSGYMSTLAYFNCAGHSSLANGEVLICGGSPAVGDLPCELIPGAPGYDAALRACYDNPGNHYAYTFNPQNLTSPWTRKADIPGITGDPDTQFAISHWKYYPTLTTLWDGRVLLTSGRPSSSSIDPPPTGGYSCNYCVSGSGICKFCCEDDYPLVFDPRTYP